MKLWLAHLLGGLSILAGAYIYSINNRWFGVFVCAGLMFLQALIAFLGKR